MLMCDGTAATPERHKACVCEDTTRKAPEMNGGIVTQRVMTAVVKYETVYLRFVLSPIHDIV